MVSFPDLIENLLTNAAVAGELLMIMMMMMMVPMMMTPMMLIMFCIAVRSDNQKDEFDYYPNLPLSFVCDFQ